MDALHLLDPSGPALSEQEDGVPGHPARARSNFLGSRRRPDDGTTRTTPTVSDLVGPEAAPSVSTPVGWRGALLDSLRARLQVLARPRPAGAVMFGAGALLLLLLGYIYFFTPLSAERSQHLLLQSINAEPSTAYNLALGAVPSEGNPVAVLEIPALHLVQVVVQGVDATDLRHGPGHMRTTPLPGQPGNAVIAGRRATFGAPFGAVGSLRPGQIIKVVDGYGSFRYSVKKVVTVAGGQRQDVGPSKSNRLTLVTSSSAVLPSGQVEVEAALVGSAVEGTGTPRFNATEAEAGMNGDPESGILALAWGAVFLALLLGTSWLLRRRARPTVVYLMATPVLVAVGLFACQSAVGFLPSTV